MLTCQKCKYTWHNRTHSPKTCPNPKCRSTLWNQPQTEKKDIASQKAMLNSNSKLFLLFALIAWHHHNKLKCTQINLAHALKTTQPTISHQRSQLGILHLIDDDNKPDYDTLIQYFKEYLIRKEQERLSRLQKPAIKFKPEFLHESMHLDYYANKELTNLYNQPIKKLQSMPNFIKDLLSMPNLFPDIPDLIVKKNALSMRKALRERNYKINNKISYNWDELINKIRDFLKKDMEDCFLHIINNYEKYQSTTFKDFFEKYLGYYIVSWSKISLDAATSRQKIDLKIGINRSLWEFYYQLKQLTRSDIELQIPNELRKNLLPTF